MLSKSVGVLIMRTPSDCNCEKSAKNTPNTDMDLSSALVLSCLIQCISKQLTGHTWCMESIVYLASQAVNFERRPISSKHLARV